MERSVKIAVTKIGGDLKNYVFYLKNSGVLSLIHGIRDNKR
jgi:hypothetical protein